MQNSGDVQARFFNEPGLFFSPFSNQPSAFSHLSEVSSEARDPYRHEKARPLRSVPSILFFPLVPIATLPGTHPTAAS